jgi:predicted  nucleic acid-binding Zn-ribbon protein
LQEQAAAKQLEELQRELTAAQEARAEAEARAQQLTDRLQGSADEAAAKTEAAEAEISAAKEAAARAEAQVAQLQSKWEKAEAWAKDTSDKLSEAQRQIIQVICVCCC